MTIFIFKVYFMKGISMEKILILSVEYPPKGGGAGVVIKEICSKLKNDYDITLITNNQKIINENFKIIKVKKIPKMTFINYYFELKKIDLNNYSKIIINDVGSSLVASLFFSKKIQEKCLLFLHGTEYEEIFQFPQLIFKLVGFPQKYQFLLKNCKKIITVSNYMKKKFLEATQFDFLENKMQVIYNGVDNKKYYPEKIDLYKKFKIDSEYKILLTASRIVEKKGFKKMFEIFGELIEEGNKFFWIIAGEGSYRKKLEKMAKQKKLENQIIFLGKKNYEELRKLYSSVDLFWLLSEYEEALGLVYIEAQMCGCKVMGYKNSGVEEAICNKKNFYKEKKDIIKILEVVKEEIPLEFLEKFSVKNQYLKLKKEIDV